MKTNFKFNHKAQHMHDALGIDQVVVSEIGEKIVNTLEEIAEEDKEERIKTESLHDFVSISISKIAEKIETKFTDEQIVILASLHIKKTLEDAEQAALKNPIAKMLAMLRTVKDSGKDDFEDFIKSDSKDKN